jgi:putative ABC transport system ATP-binding protein
VVVLGPSGCGKTTLINLIGSLDTPTDGRIQVGEVDVTGAGRKELFEYRRHLVSFIFQSFNIFPGLTAEENVQFGIDAAERKTGPTAHQVLANVGLADRANHFPHELSGGEQQRVAIARALATGNPILLADEPTGELDFKTGVQILELLKAQAGPDTAVVVVTHNREISRIADRVVELSSGRIEHDGPPRDGRAEMSDLHW